MYAAGELGTRGADVRAVVTGMIATYSMGGVGWDYGQYALGLERMGFEVYYLEDTGVPAYTYNPAVGGYEEDPSYGVRFLREALAELSPSLAERWHYRAADGRTYGMEPSELAEIVASADLLLNVSGGCVLRPEYARCPRKALIDTDPGWNHFVIFPRWDSRPAAERAWGFRAHDHFFTYAQRLGAPDCPLPTFGLTWHPTRPPAVLDCWRPLPPARTWTTVMSWSNYLEKVEHGGVEYGAKELEFGRIEELPRRSREPFEVSVNVNGLAPLDRWRALGWSVVDAEEMSKSLSSYRSYIEGSRGEFSVAKNVYVATRSGWFSCRSVCYLAAGRPVALQDTGFSELLPTGEGVLAFSDLQGAAAAVAAVEDEYERHCTAAREIARERFDSALVLGEMLERMRMS